MRRMCRLGLNRWLVAFVAVVMAGLAVGCDGSLYYADYAHLDPTGWMPEEKAAFTVEADDTTQAFNFLVEVRNTADYAYSNIFFFINTTFPDGSVARDTLECPLADATGRWYGKRTGRYVDSRYYFRRNARFPMQGTYHFDFSHAMRDTVLTGIKDIGLRIEYCKSK